MSELSQLELEAQVIDAELAGGEFKQPDQAQAPSLNADFKPAILKFLSFPVRLISERIAFTSTFFDEVAINDIAESLIKVADVEKVDLKKLMGDPNSRMGAWIALAVSVGMPSFMFYLAFLETTKKPLQPAEKEVHAAPAEQTKTEFHGG